MRSPLPGGLRERDRLRRRPRGHGRAMDQPGGPFPAPRRPGRRAGGSTAEPPGDRGRLGESYPFRSKSGAGSGTSPRSSDYLSSGVHRVILGTAAIADPDFLREACGGGRGGSPWTSPPGRARRPWRVGPWIRKSGPLTSPGGAKETGSCGDYLHGRSERRDGAGDQPGGDAGGRPGR